jgi:transposase
LSNEIVAIAWQDAGCERLMSVPGIGPIISSAMVAAIGAGDVFTKGRDFAAWLGLVPKQISTGDRTILGKISRRGNRYLRVQACARAASPCRELAPLPCRDDRLLLILAGAGRTRCAERVAVYAQQTQAVLWNGYS